MSVADNIVFSLEVRGRQDIRRKSDELLDLVALNGQGDKKVHELPLRSNNELIVGFGRRAKSPITR